MNGSFPSQTIEGEKRIQSRWKSVQFGLDSVICLIWDSLLAEGKNPASAPRGSSVSSAVCLACLIAFPHSITERFKPQNLRCQLCVHAACCQGNLGNQVIYVNTVKAWTYWFLRRDFFPCLFSPFFFLFVGCASCQLFVFHEIVFSFSHFLFHSV